MPIVERSFRIVLLEPGKANVEVALVFCVLETNKYFFNVTRDRNFACSRVVIPFDSHSTILSPLPV